jgi:hypothetical protein
MVIWFISSHPNFDGNDGVPSNSNENYKQSYRYQNIQPRFQHFGGRQTLQADTPQSDTSVANQPGNQEHAWQGGANAISGRGAESRVPSRAARHFVNLKGYHLVYATFLCIMI